MKIVYSDKHAQHDPQTFFVRGVKQRSAEQPERAERLLAAAKGAGHDIVSAKAHGSAPAETVHTPEYVDFLKTIAHDWAKLPNASTEVVPGLMSKILAVAGELPPRRIALDVNRLLWSPLKKTGLP